MAAYNHVAYTHDKLYRQTVMLSFIKFFYRRANGIKEKLRSKKASVIATKIESSSKPLEFFSTIQSDSLVSNNVLWKVLSYFQEKRSPLYDILICDVKNEELKALVYLRSALSSPSPIPHGKLKEVVSLYKERKGSLENESDFRRMLIALIVKKMPSSQAYEAFSSAEILDKITIHQALKVLHKASIEGETEVFCALYRQYAEQMTPAALSKTRYWECRLYNNNQVSYKSIEDNFCQLEKSLSSEYRKYLLPLFSSISEDKDLLDCQINESSLTKLKSSIELAVETNRAYSFVRFNDGEGYAFPNALPCAFDVERQELHWWGEVLDPVLRKKIQEDFKRSLQQHDLVGIPSVFRFIDEFNVNRDYSIFSNALLCRLFTLCYGYLKVYDGKAYITEGQINLYLFNKAYIARLASLAQRVVFISGAKKEYLQRVFSELQHASYIELPTHRLLKTEKFSYSDAVQPLPYVYEDYLEQIRKLAGPGVVFFISAGFIGKIFAAEIAKNGGVALDVGQALMNIVANDIND